ncbi:hypothetical protein CSC2_06030 [Clostridium zeae]|uniref:Uncharacterized protein n=1 Tax=Clostridium zeae TaxID=2759022 RepID=A0ABQ1E5P8_9CLOT|nr:hypothetical protein [Clostridium zeae]GFZ30077.1 hypothetical protein CSC2_06030 [Clostridium zeae]
MANGIMDFNELGIAFVSDDVPKKKAKKVEEEMNEIIEKYKLLAQNEFDKFLAKLGLESVMGVVIKKGDCKIC